MEKLFPEKWIGQDGLSICMMQAWQHFCASDFVGGFLIDSYQQTLNTFVGPTEVLISGDTLQLKDYSKTDWPWTMFNPEAKQQRHDTVFPEECKRAFEMGAKLFK